jgi:hypothetical protein
LSLIGVGFLALLPGPQPAAHAAELKPRTVEAFDAYMRTAEQRLQKQIKDGPFLWMDGAPARVQQVRQGQTVVGPWTSKGEIEITGGLIHDWVGAAFIPGATLDGVLALVQNYDNDKNIFKPEVVDSKLLSRNGDDFTIYLRLLKKKVLTVVLNTRHDVHYIRLDRNHCYSRSYSARIAEVENPGEPGERELAPGKDQGFLWRLNSFWRFEERDGGVYLECEAISLTRDVPTGLGWLIDPIIRALPKDSLTNTLNATSRAVLAAGPAPRR